MNFVQEIKDMISEEAEQLVNSVFPQKTSQLDALLNSENFQLDNLKSIAIKTEESLAGLVAQNDPNEAKPSASDKEIGEQPMKKIKSFAFSKGESLKSDTSARDKVTSNVLITQLASEVRPEIISLMEHCNTVRTWVLLLLPKMEDGNNFGVSVQEDTMAELKGVETESAVFLDTISSYFYSRAKVSSKCMKHPNITDYARFLAEEDEKQFVSLRHTVAELRNFYSSLHDLIMKNIEKIKRPRSNNISSMY